MKTKSFFIVCWRTLKKAELKQINQKCGDRPYKNEVE